MINLRWEPDGSFEVEADSAQDLVGLMTMSSWQGVKDRLAELMKMRGSVVIGMDRGVAGGTVRTDWPVPGTKVRRSSGGETVIVAKSERALKGNGNWTYFDDATSWYSEVPDDFWRDWKAIGHDPYWPRQEGDWPVKGDRIRVKGFTETHEVIKVDVTGVKRRFQTVRSGDGVKSYTTDYHWPVEFWNIWERVR